jgi:hypothetical protein
MHGTHQPSDAEATPDGGREESKPAENQTNSNPVTESNKEPLLPVLQEATSSPSLTNALKQPGDLLPQLGVK